MNVAWARDEDSGEPAVGRKRYRISLANPILGEEEVEGVRRVLYSGVLTNGPATARFESRFAERHGCEFGVAFANGTVALTAMYLALGIGPGDEVIVPSMTFVSTATSVLHVGATPVFADMKPDTFTMDPTSVATCLSCRTKAIVAMHYGGQPADMHELRAIADDVGVWLLEDAAEAHGASYRSQPVGGLGHAGMFSFTPTKNITTGEGGMVTTADGDLARKLRLLRNHGQTSPYEHETVGYNWRISEIHAAIGCVQLDRLDAILAKKRENAKWMEQRLAGVPGIKAPLVLPDREHVFMLYTVLVDGQREEILTHLHNSGIEGRLYFPPVHLQPIFRAFRRVLPVTELLAPLMLSIPFHAQLGQDELTEIADALQTAVPAMLDQA